MISKKLEEGDFVIVRRLPDSCNNCQIFSTCRKNVVGSEKFFGEILYIDSNSADVHLELVKYNTSCISETIQIPLESLRIHPLYHAPGRYKCLGVKIGDLEDEHQFIELKELLEKKDQPIFVVEYTNLIVRDGGLILDIRGFFEDDNLEDIYSEIEDCIFVSVYPTQLNEVKSKTNEINEINEIIL